MRKAQSIRSCCGISQHFISRQLINRHLNQLGYQSYRSQKSRRCLPCGALAGRLRHTSVPSSSTRHSLPPQPRMLDLASLGGQPKFRWLIRYVTALLPHICFPNPAARFAFQVEKTLFPVRAVPSTGQAPFPQALHPSTLPCCHRDPAQLLALQTPLAFLLGALWGPSWM